MLDKDRNLRQKLKFAEMFSEIEYNINNCYT